MVKYREEIVPQLMREFAYSHPLAVPRLRKIVVNVGLGEALTDQKAIEACTRDLNLITGQKPVVTLARKSVASFHLRKGQPIGVMVTLRGDRMYAFLDKLFNLALPATRDFRGIPRNAFDGHGNYSLGVREQMIFPEIEYSQVDKPRGLQVTMVTSGRTDAEAARLLELLGAPFTREAASVAAAA